MSKSRNLAIVALLVLTAAFFAVRYMNDFSRLKKVEIGNTPFQPGTISQVVLTNNQSSKVDVMLHCYFKVRSGGNALFSQAVHLPATGRAEFDVNPELAGRELPRIVANKACEAIWQGPFGIKLSAWWLVWEYGRPAYKVSF
jgi:hypothetical protein